MGFDASRTENLKKQRLSEAAALSAPIRNAVMIGNFPPRKCGIATFTRDAFASLREQMPGARWSLVAMDDLETPRTYPLAVTHVIQQGDPQSYIRVADQLNRSGAEVAFIQHEFGIFGGEAGSHLLLLMRRLQMPVIVTLHTVLETPDPVQKRVMDEILTLASAAIVMTETGADILARVHRVGPDKVLVIPHGAPERPFASPEAFKPALGLAGRKVLMTFGLLSPNKGVETIIRGLPEILKRHPDTLYLVVGATHPHRLMREGEAYRETLVTLAASLGVADNLRFINRFVSDEELINLLQAADLYVTPYLTEAQITSGTLSYAIALGKPIVSTPYLHAKEALADGVGVICPFGDEKAFAREISGLLSDQIRREAMARRAYKFGEPSRWRKVAAASLELALACRAAYQRRVDDAFRALAQPKLTAIQRIADDCGVMQHSCFLVPDRRHGYCTDDNARALTLAVRLSDEGEAGEALTRLLYSSAAFVNHAWNAESGRFRNFMGFDRHWLDDGGSDDSCGRAFEALCITSVKGPRTDLRDWAVELAREVAGHASGWQSIRCQALVIKAAFAAGDDLLGKGRLQQLVEPATDKLMTAYAEGRRLGYGWFEPRLTYDNARLPEALILAGQKLESDEIMAAGLEALDFIMRRQTSRQGCFSPVATSSFDRQSADQPGFDQQPIEALATIEACLAAWRATGDPRHAGAAETAFNWFGGHNVHGLPLANPEDGGCYDGLTADDVNRNQGAESILSYNLASAAIRNYLRERPRTP